MEEETWQPREEAPWCEPVWAQLNDGTVLLGALKMDLDTWMWRDAMVHDYEVVGWRPIDWA